MFLEVHNLLTSSPRGLPTASFTHIRSRLNIVTPDVDKIRGLVSFASFTHYCKGVLEYVTNTIMYQDG
jgi:hypothetical protein